MSAVESNEIYHLPVGYWVRNYILEKKIRQPNQKGSGELVRRAFPDTEWSYVSRIISGKDDLQYLSGRR